MMSSSADMDRIRKRKRIDSDSYVAYESFLRHSYGLMLKNWLEATQTTGRKRIKPGVQIVPVTVHVN